jgi:predicted RNA-binding protein YlxR (DUF448 family)
METARTCLGCRLHANPSELLRVVVRDGEVIPDPSATLPGRGGWVHPTRDCVEKAVTRKAFGRAFKVTTALNPERVLAVFQQ